MDAAAPPQATAPPAGRKEPFSRRAVAPVGVTPPPRTGSGDVTSSAPMASFASAKPVQPTAATPPSSAVAALGAVADHATAVEAAEAAEQQRLAALAARRTQAAERPSWFMSSPPQAPVSASPFALVSSRPEPAGPTPEELAEAQRVEQDRQAAWEEQRRAHQAAEAAAAAEAERAQLQAFHSQAGATVVHPDSLRGALTAPVSPPTPVVPPIVEAPPAAVQAEAPVVRATYTPPVEAPVGLLSTRPPETTDAPAKGRRGRLKRGERKAVEAAPTPDPAAEAAAGAAEAITQDAAMEAYRRFAREGTMVTEDYYRGPVEDNEPEAEPAVVIAESLIPTGKPRLAKQPDKPRGPKIVAALVVLAIGGGAYYYETHQVTVPPITGLPSVTLDQTTASADASFTVPAAATSGPSYRLTVPAGWKAISSPTRPGGAHTDVTVTEPILGLTVTVHSEKASAPDTVTGRQVDTALRVFGHPAGIVAPAEPAGSATVSRVATVTRDGVRYSVTLTVPRESAVRDYARAATVARSLRS